MRMKEQLSKIYIRFGWEWQPTKEEAIAEFIRLGYEYDKEGWNWCSKEWIMKTAYDINEFFISGYIDSEDVLVDYINNL